MVKLALEGDNFTGRMLIDDEYLRERCGYTDADLAQYRMVPDFDPPRLLAMDGRKGADWAKAGDFRRGDIRKLDTDMGRSKL